MGRSASRVLFLTSLVGLGFVSLRPSPAVDWVVDAALMPARVLAEVVRPARLLRSGAVRAADRRLQELQESDIEARKQLFRDSRAFVVPERHDLTVGRTFVRAEVLKRVEGDVDRVVVRVESDSCQGLRPGMPVVSGEVYVGRVHALDTPAQGLATIDLVTRKGFFVGGEVQSDEPRQHGVPAVRLVVGGVRQSTRRARGRETEEVLLDVHNPSLRKSAPGRVTVDEGGLGTEPYRAESLGFLLGTTVPPARGDEAELEAGLEPRLESGNAPAQHSLEDGLTPFLDYGAGLFQVAIVCPENVDRAPEHPSQDVLLDPFWRRVDATSVGDPSAWREGLKLAAGRLNGLRTGAAVASGVRLVGRVSRAGFLTSDAALLGDPGLWVPAIARIDGRAEPLVLGRLVSLGREVGSSGGGTILLHWEAVVQLEGGDGEHEPVHAVLYTGSGEPLVPGGLLIGEAFLPRGPGPHLLRLEEPVDTRRLGSLWVRLPLPTQRDAEEAP